MLSRDRSGEEVMSVMAASAGRASELTRGKCAAETDANQQKSEADEELAAFADGGDERAA